MNTIANVSTTVVEGVGQAALDQCAATDMEAMLAVESATIHSARDMGSCDVTITAEPETGKMMEIIILASSGEAMIIPRAFLAKML